MGERNPSSSSVIAILALLLVVVLILWNIEAIYAYVLDWNLSVHLGGLVVFGGMIILILSSFRRSR